METIQKEDLQLLSEILKERLVAEIPDSQEFEVKCGIKNDELVILTTHPTGIIVNSKEVFSVLEQALQWQFHYQTERVQFFIRAAGDKRPYDKYIADFPSQHLNNIEEIKLLDEDVEEQENKFLSLEQLAEQPVEQLAPQPVEQPVEQLAEQPIEQPVEQPVEQPDIIFPPSDLESHLRLDVEEPIRDSLSLDSETPLFSLSENQHTETHNNEILYNPFANEEHESESKQEEEEKFDPFANVPDKPRKKLGIPFPPLSVILGFALVVAMISGAGAFILYRGCAISECKEIQNGQQLQNDYPQKIKTVKSEKDLPAILQQLETSITELKTIPGWSPKYAQSQELITSFTEKSAKIDQVAKALQAASAVEKTTVTPVQSLEELKARQKKWRQVITSLQAIKPSNQFHRLVKIKLPIYQNSLKAVNQQIVAEETWLTKLANAKTVGEAAINLQATAKSAPEWQKAALGLQSAISTLKTIPVDSLGHKESQKVLNEYQPKLIVITDHAKKEQAAATAYQQAINFANQAKGFSNQNNYQASVNAWKQAVQNAKKVTEGSFYYKQAAALVESYNVSLRDAEQQLQMYGDLTETRNQLNATCTSSIKICTFTVNNQGINVRLTVEYDQRLQGGSQEMQNHFRSLQEALSVISKNSNLPVVLTNSKGEERYMRKPQS